MKVSTLPLKILITLTALIYLASPALAAERLIAGKDGAPMVHVPAGWFIMGSEKGDEDEKPRRRVYLDGFYIDKYPVTNERYRAAGLHSTCENRRGFDRDTQPVVCVSWRQAKAYCEKTGKRLPAEAEWEKAARGADGRIYPWGDRWEPSKVIWRDNSDEKTHPVDRSYSTHASPFGAVDMAGNVWEWVQDWYGEDYYRKAPEKNPRGPDAGSSRVLRGGSKSSLSEDFRAAHRSWDNPNFKYAWDLDRGFRCAKGLD